MCFAERTSIFTSVLHEIPSRVTNKFFPLKMKTRTPQDDADDKQRKEMPRWPAPPDARWQTIFDGTVNVAG